MSSTHPSSTTEVARQRRDLAPNQQAAFEAFSKAVFANGALPAKMKQVIAGCRCPRDAMPLLHSWPHEGGIARGCLTGRTHGGDLGCGRDARRRRLRAFYLDARDACRMTLRGRANSAFRRCRNSRMVNAKPARLSSPGR